MKRRRGKGRSSTVPIILMIGFALLVLAGIAVLVTQDWEDLPAEPEITYRERPEDRRDGDSWAKGAPGRPGRNSDGEAAGAEPDASPSDVTGDVPPETPEADYYIVGTVVDGRTQEPVKDVRLLASRVPTEDEEAAYKARDREVVEGKRTDEFGALIDEKQRLWADASAVSDGAGQFRIPVVHGGDYKITAIPRNYLRKTIDKTFVGESRPEWRVDIALELGATLSGRVTDSSTNEGIEGITINATLEPANHLHQAVTAADGTYTVGGLAPGSYSVIADIEQTPYRVTKVLPYRKTSIGAPDQEVRGIDFKLDRGGVVWGHVTKPDGTPVRADVLLCTSDSVVSQALNSMVRRAPPLGDRSAKEDGYYELVGVPLNEEWRVYATAENSAPTLTRSFIVTPRNKTVNVPIEISTGSIVYGQVVDRKGTGVADAKVLCIPSYGQLLAPLESATAMREAVSDAEGYFTLNELPAGNYQVMAHKEGYKYALKGTALYANGFRDVENFRVVLEDIEAGDYAVYGTVTDAAGRAIPEARVVFSGIGTESLQGVGRETTTDQGGDFRFDGVEIGTYVLNVTKGGYSAKTVNKVLLDEQNDVVLEAASIVRGRVLVSDTNQAPEGGYSVAAVQLGGLEEDRGRNLFSMLSDMEDGEQTQEFNNTDGRYELSLAAGTWRLEGRAAPLAPARKEITLLPGEVIENVDLILTNDGSSIEGYVRITDGESPQGALVSLIEADSPSQALTFFAQDGGSEHSTQVGDDGMFFFERLAAGTYYAVARHPAYPQAMSPAIFLEADDEATGVEVVMGPGGTLQGYVYENGQPVAGRIVTVVAQGQPYTGTTDGSGAYEINNIPEGEYRAYPANIGIGLGGDLVETQGYPVTIWSGSVTQRNFGEFDGIPIHVQLSEFAAGGIVAFNPADAVPAVGSGLMMEQIPGVRYGVVNNTVTIEGENVTPGAWRIDVYTRETLSLNTFQWRGGQEVIVTGEEPDVTVEIFLN